MSEEGVQWRTCKTHITFLSKIVGVINHLFEHRVSYITQLKRSRLFCDGLSIKNMRLPVRSSINATFEESQEFLPSICIFISSLFHCSYLSVSGGTFLSSCNDRRSSYWVIGISEIQALEARGLSHYNKIGK